MKKFDRLLIIEGDGLRKSLLADCETWIEALYQYPPIVLKMGETPRDGFSSLPLILFHTNLISTGDLQQYSRLQATQPSSAIVIVADEQDEEISMLALEAGAEDVISPSQLTKNYLYKAAVVSQRRYQTHHELNQSVEKTLQRSEEKYRLLVEQQADAITIFNEQGRICDVNSSAIQLLQYSREEFQQLTLLDILTPEDARKNPVNLDHLKQGHTTIKQRRMRCKDGSIIQTEVHTKLLGNGLFLSSVRDLTERLEVQRQLQKEIELSDSIINGLPHLFYLFTSEGKYLRWNQQLQNVSGYSADEISKISPLHFFTEEEKPVILDAIEKVYAKGQHAVEANLLTKDGKTIPHYFTGLTVDYAGTQCLMGVGIDLSTVKTLEKELSQQKIAQQKKIMQAMIHAEEKEKNKLGLELHDNVNQILSVVRMYLSILDSDSKMKEITLPKTIGLLNTAIDEIRHLSHSLAVSYKFEAGLVEALEDMMEKIRLTRDFSICLCTSEILDDCTNNDQKLAIYRIVQEQVNNIIKYAKATEVKIEISTTPEEISLEIRDNGQGFNPAKAGKGLGLSNITTRAEALEGKVCLRSAPGKGCRLTVTIPLHLSVLTEED